MRETRLNTDSRCYSLGTNSPSKTYRLTHSRHEAARTHRLRARHDQARLALVCSRKSGSRLCVTSAKPQKRAGKMRGNGNEMEPQQATRLLQTNVRLGECASK